MGVLDVLADVTKAVVEVTENAVSAVENLREESGAISKKSNAVDKSSEAHAKDVSAVDRTSSAVDGPKNQNSGKEFSSAVDRNVEGNSVPSTKERPSRVAAYRGEGFSTTTPVAAPSSPTISPSRVQAPVGKTDADLARQARTLVVIAPTDLSRDSSRVGDSAQAIAAAGRLLGPNISVVLVQPSSQNTVRVAPTQRGQGSLTVVSVNNAQQLQGALRIIAAGERLSPSTEEFPVVSDYVVIGPSSQVGKDALDAIDNVTLLEESDINTKVVVVEPDYLTITDTREAAKTRGGLTGPLRQSERNSYTPSDARALLGADLLAADSPRIVEQAVARATDGDLDLSSTRLLKGLDPRNHDNEAAIRSHVASRTTSLPAISHSTAAKLRDGGTLAPAQLGELRAHGRLLIDAGLTQPLDRAAKTAEVGHEIGDGFDSDFDFDDDRTYEIERPLQIESTKGDYGLAG